MAQLSDLKLKYRLLIQGYPFRRVDWRPGTRLIKPLRDARIALIATAGFYLRGQKPFDRSYRHDDCSFREIPWGTPAETLQIGQSSDAFDRSGIDADRNLLCRSTDYESWLKQALWARRRRGTSASWDR